MRMPRGHEAGASLACGYKLTSGRVEATSSSRTLALGSGIGLAAVGLCSSLSSSVSYTHRAPCATAYRKPRFLRPKWFHGRCSRML